MQLPSFYLIATHDPEWGIYNAGDITADKDQAYDQFADCVDKEQDARVFLVQFDVESNALETTSEVTDVFRQMYLHISEAREFELNEVAEGWKS
jgi:hypothetical protein